MSAVAEQHEVRAATLLGQLALFCREHGRPCFVAWPDELLAEYLEFHARNGSLSFVRGPDGEIDGLAIGWRCRENNPEQHWQAWDASGNTFLFSQVVCRTPGALRALVLNFMERVPDWRGLKLLARRAKQGRRLLVYSAELIERLAAQIPNAKFQHPEKHQAPSAKLQVEEEDEHENEEEGN